jgi:hypothetical protein
MQTPNTCRQGLDARGHFGPDGGLLDREDQRHHGLGDITARDDKNIFAVTEHLEVWL